MDSGQVQNALCKDAFVSPYYLGVIPADRLPNTVSAPFAVVINLDNHNDPGSHWVAICAEAREKPVSDADSSAEAKAKLYYESCMDVNETMAAVGAKPLLDLLDDAGGWNVSGEFNVSSWSFQRTMQILQNKYSMGGLFTWAVGEDDRNSTRHIIQIDQGGLALPTRDYYLNKTANEKVLTAYLEYMSKIGVLLGGEQNETIKQMADIIHFETLLAEITIPSDERRDEESLYNLMTVEELQNLAPFMDWLKYLNDAFSNVNQTISRKDTIVVYAPKYLEHLTTLIDNFTSTDDGKIIVNNYLVWQTVRTLTPCLSRPFRDAYNILRKALVGSDSVEETWRYCVADTGSALGFAVGAMFVREAFHGESKPLAEEMINRVKAAFRKNLRKVKWMDPDTLAAADSKADAITDMIGFPDYILNPGELDAKYADLEIKPREYFQNNIRVNRYNLRINLQLLRQSVNKTRWSMTPPTVNAYYTPTKNQIVFPAGILQAPFYDKAYPRSLNFGAMGVVMGHELTHAFDDEGREYDKNGNLHKWWDNGTIERFKEKAECLVDQYSSYKAGEHNLNGKQVLGENIADNGGLKAAYMAYRDWVGEAGEELPLPGINFTHSQLFFLGFTQVWCSANTNEASALQIEKDPHSPAKFRVIGPLSNSLEFAKLFRCPLGSRMNPEKKCEVW